jgi:hypothetical protein
MHMVEPVFGGTSPRRNHPNHSKDKGERSDITSLKRNLRTAEPVYGGTCLKRNLHKTEPVSSGRCLKRNLYTADPV